MRKHPLGHSIQREIFNRIEHDPSVEYISKDSYRVFLPRKWINKMAGDNEHYFFVVDRRGSAIPSIYVTGFSREYIDITLTEGHEEYVAMMKL